MKGLDFSEEAAEYWWANHSQFGFLTGVRKLWGIVNENAGCWWHWKNQNLQGSPSELDTSLAEKYS